MKNDNDDDDDANDKHAQNLLVKDKINDKDFMEKQINCFLNDVGCDAFGKQAMG